MLLRESLKKQEVHVDICLSAGMLGTKFALAAGGVEMRDAGTVKL